MIIGITHSKESVQFIKWNLQQTMLQVLLTKTGMTQRSWLVDKWKK